MADMARDILVLALASNASPKRPMDVLTQAIGELRAGFDVIRATRENTSSGEYDRECEAAEYSLSHRLEALECFVTKYMVVQWIDESTESEAAQ